MNSREQVPQPHTQVWRAKLLERAKVRLSSSDAALEPALARLVAEANDALAVEPLSVVNKTRLPASGNAHDYFSYGPYWWPDPAKPDGLPYIRRDGQVNPDSRGASSDRAALQAMTEAVTTLALAFYFCERAAYAEHAALLLHAWFLNPATRMNPHLEYAQAIPGRVDGRGIGIIDTTRWVVLVDALGLLEGSPSWQKTDRAAMRAWFGRFLDWLLNSTHGKDEARQRNNHGTWYDAQVAAYALYLGRRDLARSIIAGSRAKRIDTQIEADGSQPYELARTRSFSYSVYNLMALIVLARLGEWVDVDLWRYVSIRGAGIRQAIDLLSPYADPALEWPYPQITPREPDRLLALLGEAAHTYRDATYLAQIAKLDPTRVRSQRANLLWASEQT